MSKENDLVRRGDVLAMAAEYECEDYNDMAVSVDDINEIPAIEQPMSAVEYLKAEQRMCFDENVGKRNCLSCPLSSRINPAGIYCGDYSRGYPEKTVAIVEKWAQEHPERSEEC